MSSTGESRSTRSHGGELCRHDGGPRAEEHGLLEVQSLAELEREWSKQGAENLPSLEEVLDALLSAEQ